MTALGSGRPALVVARLRRCAAMVPLAAMGCSSWLSPERGWVELPARLEFDGEPAVINAPATATRGTAFDVAFTTYGGGCVEPAKNRLVVTGLDVHIYSTAREHYGEACTSEIRPEQNVVPVTVSEAGTATVHVHGRRVPPNEDMVLTRTVTIEP